MGSTPSAPPPDLAAALADRYRLERELGAGGMAVVYLATDLKHQRQVAVKVLRADVASAVGAERFLAEIRITAALDHPRILTLIDSGTAGGFVYYVLPYVRGESLRALLDREGTLPFPRVLDIVSQVASALDYAHRQGIIHRDLKPDNILLFEGEAMLADFGIALAVADIANPRLTQEGHSLGTPYYMSPEQAAGERALTPQSDIYSLAAMTYEMLSGEPPFEGRSAQEIVAKVLTDTAPELRAARSDVPAPISAQLRRALAKEPRGRPATALEFTAGLRAAVEPATQLIQSQERTPATRRNRSLVVGLVLVAAIGGAIIAFRHRGPPVIPPAIQLTTSGHAESPTISPDGSQVAYSESDCASATGCLKHLELRETASEASRVLVDSLSYVFPFQWSADGLWLLYSAIGPKVAGGLYVVSRLGGTPTLVTDGVANFVGDKDTIFASPAAPTTTRTPTVIRILPAPWRVPVDSLLITRPAVTATLTAIRAQPRGRWLALGWFVDQSGDGVVTIVDRAGRAVDTLAVAFPNLVRWAPDGKALLVPARDAGDQRTGGGRMLRIAVDRASGRAGRRDTIIVAPGLAPEIIYDLTPEGGSLVYSAYRLGASTLTARDRGTSGTPKVLASSSFEIRARITPDGTRIAYEKTLSGGPTPRYQWNLAAADGSTGPGRAMTPVLTQAFGAMLLTDDALELLRYDSTQGTSIIRYDLATGAERIVAQGLGSTARLFPAPEGGIIALGRNGEDARLIDSLGRVRWTLALPDSIGRMVSFVLAPDRREALVFGFPRSTISDASGNYDVPLLRVAMDSGAWRFVGWLHLSSFVPYVWSPDGWIYLDATIGADPKKGLYRLRPDRTTLQRVGPSTGDDCYSASADLRRWACVAEESLSDVYLIRGLPPLH